MSGVVEWKKKKCSGKKDIFIALCCPSASERAEMRKNFQFNLHYYYPFPDKQSSDADREDVKRRRTVDDVPNSNAPDVVKCFGPRSSLLLPLRLIFLTGGETVGTLLVVGMTFIKKKSTGQGSWCQSEAKTCATVSSVKFKHRVFRFPLERRVGDTIVAQKMVSLPYTVAANDAREPVCRIGAN